MNQLSNWHNMIGIIPCAGRGSRLGHLPFSKELFPLGKKDRQGKESIKVTSEYLIDHMLDAGITNIHFVLRNGKWDIPSFYGGGMCFGFSATYHIADYAYGVPFSVYQVTKNAGDKDVILGFPDILFKPAHAYKQLLSALNNYNDTSIILGVMPILKPEKWDMVELDEDHIVKDIIIKSTLGKDQPFGWTIAAWKPAFSNFLNEKINSLLRDKTEEELQNNEIFFGHIVLDAMKAGMQVRSVVFPDGNCLDIGTLDDLELSNSFFSK
jgi:glucose-1-phosphate thymidylyltransferase